MTERKDPQLGSHTEEGVGRSPAPVENCVAHSAGKVQALERVGFQRRKGVFLAQKGGVSRKENVLF